MDNPTSRRPLGLAALITATVTLFSPMGIDSGGNNNKLSSQSLADQAVLALHSSEAWRSSSPHSQFRSDKPMGPQAEPPLELPADIRTARLMLSVESLFKATTAN